MSCFPRYRENPEFPSTPEILQCPVFLDVMKILNSQVPREYNYERQDLYDYERRDLYDTHSNGWPQKLKLKCLDTPEFIGCPVFPGFHFFMIFCTSEPQK